MHVPAQFPGFPALPSDQRRSGRGRKRSRSEQKRSSRVLMMASLIGLALAIAVIVVPQSGSAPPKTVVQAPPLQAPALEPAPGNPVVRMSTSMGDVTFELFKDKAPVSVENFLHYVEIGRASC